MGTGSENTTVGHESMQMEVDVILRLSNVVPPLQSSDVGFDKIKKTLYYLQPVNSNLTVGGMQERIEASTVGARPGVYLNRSRFT
jgi:hypothetical protein